MIPAPYRIYVIAGEASGDAHGAAVVKEMKSINPLLEVRGWGGQHLAACGVTIDTRYEEANFMGFTEVVKNLRKILSLFRKTKQNIIAFKPHAVLLIDYPGFNLRMAKWCRRRNIAVYYYIAPQLWAWKESRINILKKYVDRLFVILPFEKNFYRKHDYDVSYYGNPLVERLQEFKFDKFFREKNQLDRRSIIALLPGSRAQEIKTILPIYLAALTKECKHQIVIAGLLQHQELYKVILNLYNLNVKVIFNDLYNVLHHSKIAIVTSGTATLETALMGVPQVVCYKANKISYFIAKKLVKVNYISLVNLVAGHEIVTELIQENCNSTEIEKAYKKLKHGQYRREVKAKYRQLHEALAGDKPSLKIAFEILDRMSIRHDQTVA